MGNDEVVPVVGMSSLIVIWEANMYGRPLGVANVATGISLLPNTGDSRPLFVVALSLLTSGVVILVISTIVARKNRSQTDAN